MAIDHAVMADAIDIEPVRAALDRLGMSAAGQLSPQQRERLVAVLAKAEASAAMLSLDLCMGDLSLQHVKAHRAGF